MIRTFALYWDLYGGKKALFASAYLYLSLVITVIAYPFWSTSEGLGRPWAQTAIDIIPSMLGFSMGGMAIMLAFSSGEVFKALSQKGRKDSYFLQVVATFFHFILIQTLSIFTAVLSKYYSSDALSFVGFFFMSYALLVALATAGVLLNTARIFNASAAPKRSKPFWPPQDK